MTPADSAKIRANQRELFDRPDANEIIARGFRIAKRGYSGPPNSLLMGVSDDHAGCLLRRAAGRGDADATALLAEVPRLRVVAATSEELAVIADGGVVKRQELSFRRDVRRAFGDLISPEAMLAIIDKFHTAFFAKNEDEALSDLTKEVRSRGYADPHVGKIVLFAVKVWWTRLGGDTHIASARTLRRDVAERRKKKGHA